VTSERDALELRRKLADAEKKLEAANIVVQRLTAEAEEKAA
jgi:hypothetical protein